MNPLHDAIMAANNVPSMGPQAHIAQTICQMRGQMSSDYVPVGGGMAHMERWRAVIFEAHLMRTLGMMI